MDRYGRFGRRK